MKDAFSSGQSTRREFMVQAAGSTALVCLPACRASGLDRKQADDVQSMPAAQTQWAQLAQIAMDVLRKSNVDYGDIRIISTRRQSVRAQDMRISSVSNSDSAGFGIRALYNGAWGFAASAIMTAEEVRQVAALAVEVARASSSVNSGKVRLAPEPVHTDAVRTARQIDPFEVPLDERCNLLLEVSEILHQQPQIVRSNGYLWAQQDVKYFASTEGSAIDFDLLAIGGGFSATAVSNEGFESRSFNVPYLRTGYELIRDARFEENASRVAAEAVEKLQAKPVTAGTYDMVLDPRHLSLTIHESCGHPTELDRALGYEANYAGTSFLTPDQLNSLQYGSEHVNLVADNTLPGGLASTGYDDDGVSCQKWDIIRNGKFVGYSTNREVATRIGQSRSRGSNRADSWSNIPIVRIPNIGLQPGQETLENLIAGVDNGIYIDGHGSFSIDQKRYNFQFGGDAFWEIKNGQKGAMLKNVIYTGITPEFWNSCDGVCDHSYWQPYGFITCGKGQPGQSGWMTHGASHARFRGVDVIEGGTAKATG